MAAFACYISPYTGLQNTYSSSVSYVRESNEKYFFNVFSSFKLQAS